MLSLRLPPPHVELPDETDVIILGAGPTGLSLALDLARRGVDFLLLDRMPRHVDTSRALGVQPRTLEIFEDVGVIDEVLREGVKMKGERVFVDGSVAFDWTYDKCDSHYALPIALEQTETERILTERIVQLGYGHRIRRPVEVLAIKVGNAHHEGVEVLVQPNAVVTPSLRFPQPFLTPKTTPLTATTLSSECTTRFTDRDSRSADDSPSDPLNLSASWEREMTPSVRSHCSSESIATLMNIADERQGDGGRYGATTHREHSSAGHHSLSHHHHRPPGGGLRRVRGRYLVGCDGARSLVRKTLGIRFEGTTLPNEFIVATTKMVWGVPNDRNRFNTITANGHMLSCLALSDDRWRIIAIRRMAVTDPDIVLDNRYYKEPPSHAELQDIVSAVVPGTVLQRVYWGSVYSINSRCASTFRVGNAFIAGDAAHVHPPLGHQGMNVGISDAHNLAWKLAMVVKGNAAPALLDSYDHERRPIAESIVNYTSIGYKDLIEAKGWVTWALRNVLPLVLGSGPVNRHISGAMSQTTLRYPTDHKMIGSGHIPGAVRPGDRCPDTSLGLIPEGRRGPRTQFTRLHKLLCGPHHTLLLVLRVSLGNEGPSAPSRSWFAFLTDECTANRNHDVTQDTISDTFEDLLQVACESVGRIGIASGCPWGGCSVAVILTAGKAAIIPSSMGGGSLNSIGKHIRDRLGGMSQLEVHPSDFCVCWDLEGEVVKKLRLNLQPAWGNAGAFVMVRPDRHVSHIGYAGDHLAEREYIDHLERFYTLRP